MGKDDRGRFRKSSTPSHVLHLDLMSCTRLLVLMCFSTQRGSTQLALPVLSISLEDHLNIGGFWSLALSVSCQCVIRPERTFWNKKLLIALTGPSELPPWPSSGFSAHLCWTLLDPFAFRTTWHTFKKGLETILRDLSQY